MNQCPIATGNSFLYDFTVPDQAGTFWYHSHLSTQYCDGLRGAMVVYDPNDPHADLYDVDDGEAFLLLCACALRLIIGQSRRSSPLPTGTTPRRSLDLRSREFSLSARSHPVLSGLPVPVLTPS